MKKFLILFREPDGRTLPHSEEEIQQHRQHWKAWLEHWTADKKIVEGGSGLTLHGNLISTQREVKAGIHRVGLEIVGGFLLLSAADLQEATEIACSCPIYEFDGYAEVRELQS